MGAEPCKFGVSNSGFWFFLKERSFTVYMYEIHLKVESLLKGETTCPVAVCFDLENKNFCIQQCSHVLIHFQGSK